MRCDSCKGLAAAAGCGPRAAGDGAEVGVVALECKGKCGDVWWGRYMVATADTPVPAWFIAGVWRVTCDV